MTLLDYQDVQGVKELPSFWDSPHGIKEKIRKMEMEEAIREYIHQNGVQAHLRQTILKNGLRYVTIHLADGTPLYENIEFKKLERHTFDCEDCGHHQTLTPIFRPAEATINADLGGGFRLSSISTHREEQYSESKIKKEYQVGKNLVEVEYGITSEPKDEAWQLAHGIREQSMRFTYRVLNGIKPQPDEKSRDDTQRTSSSRAKRIEEITIVDGSMPTTERLTYGGCLVSLTEDSFFPWNHTPNYVSYIFDQQGNLKKNEDEEERSLPTKRKEFGVDISQNLLDLRATLEVLIQAAIKGEVVRVPHILKFKGK